MLTVLIQARRDARGIEPLSPVAGEEFGLERLASLLRENARASSSEILTRMREAVLSFSANTPQHDDITMMVLGYRESLP